MLAAGPPTAPLPPRGPLPKRRRAMRDPPPLPARAAAAAADGGEKGRPPLYWGLQHPAEPRRGLGARLSAWRFRVSSAASTSDLRYSGSADDSGRLGHSSARDRVRGRARPPSQRPTTDRVSSIGARRSGVATPEQHLTRCNCVLLRLAEHAHFETSASPAAQYDV